ncbi:MAG TPA: Na+/H+ antiporter subunit C [Candidatus Sumerlaeota bacterium]|nr:MAG: Na(+)/H(+) antiporter subunit C [candidate division BRC1 bacterium ADurb.BinA292]HOE96917.1 Na+/H+ antiporter subunit C [Candidatus Sumerlaeota bacterium]HOR27650.1 Na+/H+ antiporter subunit C [Candidatus Sumerlaeota bacterium]HPK02973.1 Na+/H+ antiporter subunit C [Candidatus Sumerlaeota bacterium]
MQAVLILTVGILYAAGIYMMMRRSIVKLIIGLGLLGHAANLLIFTAGGLRRGAPAFIDPDQSAAALAQIADPIPQALILTAIVIGFGVQAFSIVLIRRVYQVNGNDDLKHMRSTDELGSNP